MSAISTIYDAINTALSTELTGYTRLPNPYLPEENAELLLVKAYGVTFGSGADTTNVRELSCGNRLYVNQNYEIILINQIVTLDNDTTGQADQQKDLMEDYIKVASYIENNCTLSDSLKTLNIGHDGLIFLEGERLKYIALNVLVESEFRLAV